MVQSWAMGSHTSSPAVRRKIAYTPRSTRGVQSAPGYRFARLGFFLIAVAILFSGLTLMRTSASEKHVQPASVSERVVSVDAGDTLWGLAASLKKASMDTRDAVQMLMERNHLGSGSIQSGQILIVPAAILP